MDTVSHNKKICVIIPCLNEEQGIGAVVSRFPRGALARLGYVLDVVVVDNGSTDNTGARARAAGATVLVEPKIGKGNALRTGFAHVSDDTDFVVMLDGDATYHPEEILRLVEPLASGFCTAVVGSRLAGKINEGSMHTLNRFGSWLFTQMVRVGYQANVTDVLSGYFAWTREALLRLAPHLTSNGFAIEMEMVTKMSRLHESIYAVPISYSVREGTSNLRPFSDGMRILRMFIRNFFWTPERVRPSMPGSVAVQAQHVA